MVGELYRGKQSTTRSGKECQGWDVQEPHAHDWTSAKFPEDGLEGNYCRNPAASGDNIWCFTTDPEQKWEYCDPIHEVPSEYAEAIDANEDDSKKKEEKSATS